jgi:hypothetical protein
LFPPRATFDPSEPGIAVSSAFPLPFALPGDTTSPASGAVSRIGRRAYRVAETRGVALQPGFRRARSCRPRPDRLPISPRNLLILRDLAEISPKPRRPMLPISS